MNLLTEEQEDQDYLSTKLKRQIEQAKKKGLLASPADQARQNLLEKAKAKSPGLTPITPPPDSTPAAQLVTMKTTWVDVTPALAADWLKNNICNRKLRKAVVANYARQMKRGEWLPIAQDISFDTRHRLINGQHRLTAVIESGVTIRVLVTTGVPERIANSEVKPMDLMDTGLPRSLADQLQIQHNIQAGAALAAIVRAIIAWILPKRTYKLSVGEVLLVYRLFQDPIDFVLANRSKEHGLKQTGILAAFALAIASEGTGSLFYAPRYQMLIGSHEAALPASSPLVLLSRFLRAPDAILLTRTNDRALVPLVLGVLEAEHTSHPIADLQNLPEPTTICTGLAPQIQQIKAHFTGETTPS
jgi:hypothetical protein